MTNQDPIAALGGIEKARQLIGDWRDSSPTDYRHACTLALRAIDAVDPKREAKIAAWSAKLCEANNRGMPAIIDECRREAVAFMRSAPDDAKLRELRAWVLVLGQRQTSHTLSTGESVLVWKHAWNPLLAEIDRLLSKPPEPAPSTTKTLKVTQTGEHFCETQCEERERLRAENARLQGDLDAARADQAAMAREQLKALQQWAETTEKELRHHYKDRPTWWISLHSTLQLHLAALPAQQPKPEPDAATRDGDDVLLSYVRTHGGLLNPCAFENAILTLCRRELARGGK